GPNTHGRDQGKDVSMLFLAIPNGKTSGQCKIDGEPQEFLITDREFRYRSPEGGEWDVRKILQAIPGETLTQYLCSSADPSSDDEDGLSIYVSVAGEELEAAEYKRSA